MTSSLDFDAVSSLDIETALLLGFEATVPLVFEPVLWMNFLLKVSLATSAVDLVGRRGSVLESSTI
jgi:hypothetical protein